MCGLCAQLSTFSPECNLSERANIRENADATSGTSTAYTISAGDTFSGRLGVTGDRDWVRVSLDHSETYSISLSGTAGGGGTLRDPYLRVYDANGSLLHLNDDGGPGLDSEINFCPNSTGTYYIAAGAYADRSIGSYQIAVEPVRPSESGSIDDLANYLTDGFWRENGEAARSFNTSTSTQITVNLSGLTTSGQGLARRAFEAWEAVADIDFVETSNTGARITFDDNQSGAYSTSVTSGSTLLSSHVNVSTAWVAQYGTTLDSYSFQTYIHEIGHAIGLGHQGHYNGSATYGRDEAFRNDSWQMSVMSYFDQSDNTSINASTAGVMTAMMADIVAIQNLYGAPGSSGVTAGNTVWGVDTNLTGYLGTFDDILRGQTVAGLYDGEQVAWTIYDQDGIDTLNLSALISNNRIDLRDTQFSDVNGLIGNVGIARGTVIENAIGGTGQDNVTGNDAANRIEGRAGNDMLFGGAGRDTLEGGADNDQLRGGSDFDVLLGGVGNDTLFGDNGRDTLRGGDGNDELRDNGQRGDLGRDLFLGENGNDVLSGNGGNDSLDGGNGNDTLFGGLDNDQLFGGNQFDRLAGQMGNDTLFGGNGRDTLLGGNGDDELRDNGQRGDLARDLFLGENGNDTLLGGGGNDSLDGGNGNDRLLGGLDNDQLFGGNQFDYLDGEAGNDTLFGGNGRDTLLGGDGNDRLVDNGQVGDLGRDILNGEAGDDFLRIGGGNDTATGGAGSDTFEFFGAAIGMNTVTDFDLGTDRLRLDDALWTGTLTAQQVVDQFGSVVGGDLILDFGGGNAIALTGVGTTTGLADDAFIF